MTAAPDCFAPDCVAPDCSARRFLWLAALASVALVFGFGLWAIFAQLHSAVIARGQVTVADTRQIVQHPEGGVVATIHVREGDHVTQGSVLLHLEGAALHSTHAMLEARHAEIMARRARLEAERDDAPEIRFPATLLARARGDPDLRAEIEGQQRLLDARRATVAGQLAQHAQRRIQIATQIEGIDAQLDALARQRDLVAEEMATQRNLLAQGLAQASRALTLERELVRLEGEQGALRAQRANAAERDAETALQSLSLRALRREEAERDLRELSAQQVELSERLRSLGAEIDRLDLRAPVAGVVYGLQVHSPRAVLRAAEPALFIVPQDSPLIITARLAPRQIEQVYLGQRALIALPGVNMRLLPQIFAEVIHVSADAFTDSATQEGYYRVDLKLPPETLSLIQPARLLPGMPVEVFLETGARSALDYLTGPLTAYFTRALREP